MKHISFIIIQNTCICINSSSSSFTSSSSFLVLSLPCAAIICIKMILFCLCIYSDHIIQIGCAAVTVPSVFVVFLFDKFNVFSEWNACFNKIIQLMKYDPYNRRPFFYLIIYLADCFFLLFVFLDSFSINSSKYTQIWLPLARCVGKLEWTLSTFGYKYEMNDFLELFFF